MKTILLIIILILLLTIFFYNQNTSIKEVVINNKVYSLEIANTEDKIAKGLSNRAGLQNIDGMLFQYKDINKRGFWMKEMNFDLDIVWIINNKIIGVEKNVSHLDQEKKYYPPKAVNMVIEFLAGKTNQDNIKIGDEIIVR